MKESIIDIIDNKIRFLRSEVSRIQNEGGGVNSYIFEISQINILRELKNEINQL